MPFTTNFPKSGWRLTKMALGGVVLVGLASAGMAYARKSPLKTVQNVDLEEYLGQWYEIVRKPMFFEKQCDRDITATYSLNKNGKIKVDNSCYDQSGKLKQSIGEAVVANPPQNSKLKVSFLPKALRWLPVGQGDYWVLKIDEDYQTVLVGEPSRKYMWILSRSAHVPDLVVKEYLDYARTLGYDLKDLIRAKHTAQ